MYLLVRATYMFVRAMYLLFICNLPPFIYGIRILSVHMPSQLFFLKPVQSCVTRCSNKCCLKIVCRRHKLRGVFKDDKQLSNVWYSFSNKFKIVHVSYLCVVRRPCNLHSATRVSDLKGWITPVSRISPWTKCMKIYVFWYTTIQNHCKVWKVF